MPTLTGAMTDNRPVITLRTDRLLLRGWRDDDLDALAALNADPEAMRYILDGSVRDRQQSEQALRKMVQDWTERGLAARVALRFGFDECGSDRVISIRHVENTRSARVMEKLGLVHEFDTVVPGHGQPVAIHAIDAAEA